MGGGGETRVRNRGFVFPDQRLPDERCARGGAPCVCERERARAPSLLCRAGPEVGEFPALFGTAVAELAGRRVFSCAPNRDRREEKPPGLLGRVSLLNSPRSVVPSGIPCIALLGSGSRLGSARLGPARRPLSSPPPLLFAAASSPPASRPCAPFLFSTCASTASADEGISSHVPLCDWRAGRQKAPSMGQASKQRCRVPIS